MMDMINAGFETFAAVFILNHCRVLWRDKAVAGVSILSACFFTLWGAWNVVYYPAIGQHWSFVAGVAVLIANLIWVGMMLYYGRRAA